MSKGTAKGGAETKHSSLRVVYCCKIPSSAMPPRIDMVVFAFLWLTLVARIHERGGCRPFGGSPGQYIRGPFIR